MLNMKWTKDEKMQSSNIYATHSQKEITHDNKKDKD